ncbi:MAG: hypothetical protein GY873_39140 [Bosea sp.]|uniref:hypothetical protein n=1 Tax=Bosea sp. (in: a-proteobacteria) TaxID=1871050 RepID=UPI00238FB097|nr:hypothetical protein [Bosea sp. (in: a-proteobacteria)]MCP4740220.1 hypothetical protein [Bosea sp. (in: a-proteobacteria)]
MARVALVALTLFAAGCAADTPGKHATVALMADIRACDEMNFPTYMEETKCRNAAEDRQRKYFDYPDLLAMRQKKRIELSRRADRGEITFEQGKAEWDKFFAEIKVEVLERDARKRKAR